MVILMNMNDEELINVEGVNLNIYQLKKLVKEKRIIIVSTKQAKFEMNNINNELESLKRQNKLLKGMLRYYRGEYE